LSYVCSQCGFAHEGLPASTCRAPTLWLEATETERAEDFRLSDDFCAFKNEHYFVRCVLQIPIVDSDSEVFEFGVWSTLSADNFKRYYDTFDDLDQSKLGPMFGWFSNRLADYPDTQSLACSVVPQDNRQRPLIVLEPTDHPLAIQQREGVTLDYALRYLHDNGVL
jgi:hypothetical protein